jgi:hypothetical protein
MAAYPGADEALVVELALYGEIYELPERLFFRRLHAAAASAGASIEERQEHLDPRTKRHIFLWLWRHHYEHLRAVMRSPHDIATKAQLTGVLVRSAITNRLGLAKELGMAAGHLTRRVSH